MNALLHLSALVKIFFLHLLQETYSCDFPRSEDFPPLNLTIREMFFEAAAEGSAFFSCQIITDDPSPTFTFTSKQSLTYNRK